MKALIIGGMGYFREIDLLLMFFIVSAISQKLNHLMLFSEQASEVNNVKKQVKSLVL